MILHERPQHRAGAEALRLFSEHIEHFGRVVFEPYAVHHELVVLEAHLVSPPLRVQEEVHVVRLSLYLLVISQSAKLGAGLVDQAR